MTHKPYRANVGIALFNAQGGVLIGHRFKHDGPEYILPGFEWQLPQGGIDANEETRPAAMRELYEETGVTSVDYLGETLGKLQKVLTDVERFISLAVNMVFTTLIGLVFVTVYASRVHWSIAPAYLLTIPLLGGLSSILSRKIKEVQKHIVRRRHSESRRRAVFSLAHEKKRHHGDDGQRDSEQRHQQRRKPSLLRVGMVKSLRSERFLLRFDHCEWLRCPGHWFAWMNHVD